MLSRILRRGRLVGKALGIGNRVYQMLSTSDEREIHTSGGRPFVTSKDIRLLKVRSGKILSTTSGRPFYVNAPTT